MAEKYLLRVTAGPDYNTDSHVEVPVNSPGPVHISSPLIDADLNVRIHNYRGLPRSAPHTSPYFEREPHRYNKDQYSIAFRFRLKDPAAASGEANPEQEQQQQQQQQEGNEQSEQQPPPPPPPPTNDEDEDKETPTGVAATDLQFGNDFDHPIRDRLPPGFGTAMNIVKWWIDPGLDGDPYADNPYLYGAALSSFNAVFVGGVGSSLGCGGGGGEGENEGGTGIGAGEEEDGEEMECGLWIEEGGDEKGVVWRGEKGVPEEAAKRMKWALKAGSKEKWVWEYGREYGVDFFNPYIDFSEFALRLPGFNMPIMRYWDGQGLRYVSPFVSSTFFELCPLRIGCHNAHKPRTTLTLPIQGPPQTLTPAQIRPPQPLDWAGLSRRAVYAAPGRRCQRGRHAQTCCVGGGGAGVGGEAGRGATDRARAGPRDGAR
jgi:hypothetical protein